MLSESMFSFLLCFTVYKTDLSYSVCRYKNGFRELYLDIFQEFFQAWDIRMEKYFDNLF